MSWWNPFSSTPATAVPKATDGGYVAPDRSAREKCYESRDIFFDCLDDNNIIDANKNDAEARKKCPKEVDAYEKDCAKSWVSGYPPSSSSSVLVLLIVNYHSKRVYDWVVELILLQPTDQVLQREKSNGIQPRQNDSKDSKGRCGDEAATERQEEWWRTIWLNVSPVWYTYGHRCLKRFDFLSPALHIYQNDLMFTYPHLYSSIWKWRSPMFSGLETKLGLINGKSSDMRASVPSRLEWSGICVYIFFSTYPGTRTHHLSLSLSVSLSLCSSF